MSTQEVRLRDDMRRRRIRSEPRTSGVSLSVGVFVIYRYSKTHPQQSLRPHHLCTGMSFHHHPRIDDIYNSPQIGFGRASKRPMR